MHCMMECSTQWFRTWGQQAAPSHPQGSTPLPIRGATTYCQPLTTQTSLAHDLAIRCLCHPCPSACRTGCRPIPMHLATTDGASLHDEVGPWRVAANPWLTAHTACVSMCCAPLVVTNYLQPRPHLRQSSRLVGVVCIIRGQSGPPQQVTEQNSISMQPFL